MDIMALTAVELAKKIRQREISAREAVEAAFRNIEKQEAVLHSYVTLDREGAFRRAEAVQRRIDAGEEVGILAGVPVAVKDNILSLIHI